MLQVFEDGHFLPSTLNGSSPHIHPWDEEGGALGVTTHTDVFWVKDYANKHNVSQQLIKKAISLKQTKIPIHVKGNHHIKLQAWHFWSRNVEKTGNQTFVWQKLNLFLDYFASFYNPRVKNIET